MPQSGQRPFGRDPRDPAAVEICYKYKPAALARYLSHAFHGTSTRSTRFLQAWHPSAQLPLGAYLNFSTANGPSTITWSDSYTARSTLSTGSAFSALSHSCTMVSKTSARPLAKFGHRPAASWQPWCLAAPLILPQARQAFQSRDEAKRPLIFHIRNSQAMSQAEVASMFRFSGLNVCSAGSNP